ncbi:hypothetical protein A0H76_1939 [Hepatospora eriocheir]|uniref:Uncharacterized protein n=1 Tax=Hepatospora eriocheir TaxID=1081669 RepID=A0A1X0QGI2_9MICR|nr:hypothetical protein A0H76_1939 [Hepatospora eriocheir]
MRVLSDNFNNLQNTCADTNALHNEAVIPTIIRSFLGRKNKAVFKKVNRTIGKKQYPITLIHCVN